VQGIAVDQERGFVYFAFTTMLVKTDLLGKPLGSVRNLLGHLGCIGFDAKRNRVFGSLELKHDKIGTGIMKRTGRAIAEEDSFYLVSFQLDRIDRMDMDAEKDGVMRAVYLRDCVFDYMENDPVSGKLHRYGCSGIDGVTMGPVFGADENSPEKIFVSYGIYSDLEREDNDHQVILQYDPSIFDEYGAFLDQTAPHHNGPSSCEERYFFYTGNTRYGVQNLEYDPASGHYFVAVYTGEKEHFPNYNLFAIDGKKEACLSLLKGRGEEKGLLLSPAPFGAFENSESAPGVYFPYGATGMASLGDGSFYFSHPETVKEENRYSSCLHRYAFDPDEPLWFRPVPPVV